MGALRIDFRLTGWFGWQEWQGSNLRPPVLEVWAASYGKIRSRYGYDEKVLTLAGYSRFMVTFGYG
jgi:hypothetical protein